MIPKFKLGDIVAHKTSSKHNPKLLLIVALGVMKSENGKGVLYICSFERDPHGMGSGDTFARVYLLEDELISLEAII